MDDNLIIINEVIEKRFDEVINDAKFITRIKRLLTEAGTYLNKCIEYITVNEGINEETAEKYDFINNNNKIGDLVKNHKITATKSYGYLTKSKRQYHIIDFNLRQSSGEYFTKAFLKLNKIREELIGTSYVSLAYSDENNSEIAPNKLARVPLSELLEAGMVGKEGKSLKVISPQSLQKQIEKNNINGERRKKIKNIFKKSQNVNTEFLNFIRKGLEKEYNVSNLPNTKIKDVDLGYNADLFELYGIFAGTDVEKKYPYYSDEHMSGDIWSTYLKTIKNKRDFSSAIKFGERGTTTEVKTQSSESSSNYMGHALISFEQLLIQYTVLYNIIHSKSRKVNKTEQIFHMYKLYTNKEDYKLLADHVGQHLYKTFNKTNLTR